MNNIVVEPVETVEEVELANEVSEETVETVETKEEEIPKTRFDEWDRDTAVKNYQELEKLQSRHAQELGGMRKQFSDQNEILQSLLQKQEPEPETDIDTLLENPTGTIDERVDKNPKLNAVEETLNKLRLTQAITDLEKKHPGAEKTWQDRDFLDWVSSSPGRIRMHQEASSSVDNFSYADELLLNYEQAKSISTTREVIEKRDKEVDETLANIPLESTSSAPLPGKTFSKLKLQRMAVHDPEAYWDEGFQAEIIKAYQEGRVK